jgi:hypothetical protein
MAESMDDRPKMPSSRKPGWRSPETSEADANSSGSHDANMQLILRRLADEQRTTTRKKWWKVRP